MHTRSLCTIACTGVVLWSIGALGGVANAQSTQSSPGDGPPAVTHAALIQELQALKSVGFDVNDENYPNSLQQSLIQLAAKQQAGAGMVAPGLSTAPSLPPPQFRPSTPPAH
ncbi:DUF4148 domain-containing protein [Cupriavidus pauculus]|uniref:DUF4148 domain-containing protein n=1 Tax=Cupriavidus pauculus TaxID=82633 RepID=UPI0015E013A8|nr:DUF4148 domain-containing protein [Cupriavidus pauculus]